MLLEDVQQLHADALQLLLHLDAVGSNLRALAVLALLLLLDLNGGQHAPGGAAGAHHVLVGH